MSKTSKCYLETITEILRTIEAEETESIDKAATILADKVIEDRLINVNVPPDQSRLASGLL